MERDLLIEQKDKQIKEMQEQINKLYKRAENWDLFHKLSKLNKALLFPRVLSVISAAFKADLCAMLLTTG